MGEKFDALSDFQKAAVTWQAKNTLVIIQTEQGAGAYARKNPDACLGTLTEQIASDPNTVRRVGVAFRLMSAKSAFTFP